MDATESKPQAMTKLTGMVNNAEARGHTIRDIRLDEPVAPGVFAICVECGATLRLHQGRASGDAYYTWCPETPPQSQEAPQSAEEPPSHVAMRDDHRTRYATATLNDWRDMMLEYAAEKGWLTDPADANVGDLVALMHTELSELFEEYRNGRQPAEIYYNEDSEHPDKPEGVPVELLDVIIRSLHFAAIFGIDVDKTMILKHEYNLTRPFRHGGKRV